MTHAQLDHCARLRYVGFKVPERLISSDDVVEGKPSPEPYLKGAAALGFVPADCVVIEDTPAGMATGMRVIALTTTYSVSRLTAACAVLPSLVNVKARVQDGRLQVELLNG